jgi:hypothetical protein
MLDIEKFIIWEDLLWTINPREVNQEAKKAREELGLLEVLLLAKMME